MKQKRGLPGMRGHFEFSKVLALGIGTLFALTACFSAVVWLVRGEVPEEVMSYVNVPFMVVVSAYMAKAGAENVSKIRKKLEDRPSVRCGEEEKNNGTYDR